MGVCVFGKDRGVLLVALNTGDETVERFCREIRVATRGVN